MTSPLPSDDLRTYLRLLSADAQPGQFLEIRWRTPEGGIRRQFYPPSALSTVGLRIATLAAVTDVYIGVALRDTNKAGGRRAISTCRFLYVETDHPDTAASTGRLAHPPTMEIASGSFGHRHLYWQLDAPVDGEMLESSNRRLAQRLRGDSASVDVARILRPPDTLNHKHRPPTQVTLMALRPASIYRIEDLTVGLPPDSARPRRASMLAPRRPRTELDRKLLEITAADYARTLTGATPNAVGKITCPFHEDRTPSLHLYPDGTFACFGSGCRHAGTIYDFAAAWWGTGTRGAEFLQLRDRLARIFGLAA
jgi:hypothetical protein